jgi:hypothetical protein
MAKISQIKTPDTDVKSLYVPIKGRLKAWRSAVKIDRSQLVVATALRNAFGLALPLTIGITTGHVIEGVSIAGGAASLGLDQSA